MQFNLTPEQLARFWSYVQKSDGCWLWQGCRHTCGRGYIEFSDRRIFYAHRLAYMLITGDIPSGAVVQQRCGHPLCVRPDHLMIVSRSELPSRPLLSREEAVRRFWSRVDMTGDCWEWQAGRNKKGYGSTRFRGKVYTAHRLSYILAYGPIPDNLHVLHRCDNPPCVRIEHLWLSTNHDNILDSVLKGRHFYPKGRRMLSQ